MSVHTFRARFLAAIAAATAGAVAGAVALLAVYGFNPAIRFEMDRDGRSIAFGGRQDAVQRRQWRKRIRDGHDCAGRIGAVGSRGKEGELDGSSDSQFEHAVGHGDGDTLLVPPRNETKGAGCRSRRLFQPHIVGARGPAAKMAMSIVVRMADVFGRFHARLRGFRRSLFFRPLCREACGARSDGHGR